MYPSLNWSELSANPAAIHLTEDPVFSPVLEQNPDKINWLEFVDKYLRSFSNNFTLK